MPDVYKTVVTKANLQYYNGKLKRKIDDLGTVKKLRVGAIESETKTNNNNVEVLDQNHYWLMNVYNTDTSGVTHYQLANEDGTCDFNDYYNNQDTSKNGCVRINAVSDIGGTHLGDVLIYKKQALDSKFQMLNGLKFQKVDTNLHSTLEAFTNINNYSTTPNVPGDDEQMNPWFWDNKIALYPYDGELLEYVLTWSKDINDITADNEWFTDDWKQYGSWEFIGSTKQDLTGYLQDGQIEAVDNDYIDYVVDYSTWGEGVYTVDGVKSNRVMTNSSLSAEPVFVVDKINPSFMKEINVAIDFNNNEKIIVLDGDYRIIGSDANSGVQGTGFSGLRKIERLVLKGYYNFVGDCFTDTGDLSVIYLPERAVLTPENLGNCTAKIIYY